MICKNCEQKFSINDVKKSCWDENKQIFSVICSKCNKTDEICVSLFEDSHINEHFLQLLSQDSSYIIGNMYKTTNFIEKKQKDKVFEHLCNCLKCSERLEQIRLINFSIENKKNQELIDFFEKNSQNVVIVLKNKKTIDDIKSFLFENKRYILNNVFFQIKEIQNGILMHKMYFKIEKNNITIGIVSFICSNEKIILEKIWFKHPNDIKKEKKMIRDIKKGKTKLFFETLTNLYKSIN